MSTGCRAPLASNLDSFLKYEDGQACQGPVFHARRAPNGNLILVLRDKKDADFRRWRSPSRVRAIKTKLAASTARVVNVSGTRKSDHQEEQRRAGGQVQDTAFDDNPDFGGITTVILCAHGRPQDLPSGRIIGDRLGPHTPEQIVKLLTGGKRPPSGSARTTTARSCSAAASRRPAGRGEPAGRSVRRQGAGPLARTGIRS